MYTAGKRVIHPICSLTLGQRPDDVRANISPRSYQGIGGDFERLICSY